LGQVVKVVSWIEQEAPRWAGKDDNTRRMKGRVALEAFQERDSVQADRRAA